MLTNNLKIEIKEENNLKNLVYAEWLKNNTDKEHYKK